MRKKNITKDIIQKGVIYLGVTLKKERYEYGRYYEVLEIKDEWIKFKTVDNELNIRYVIINKNNICAMLVADKKDMREYHQYMDEAEAQEEVGL